MWSLNLWFQKCSLCIKMYNFRWCSLCWEAKTKFHYWFDNYKSKHRTGRRRDQKVPQKLLPSHYCLNNYNVNSLKGSKAWGEIPPPSGGIRNFAREGFFNWVMGTSGGVTLTLWTFLKTKTTFCEYWT